MERKLLRTDLLIPSVADLLFATVLVTLFFTRKSTLLHDGDTGYHIRAGEEMMRSGAIPDFDVFSIHTPPLPWTAHEWLSELLMAAVHQLLGLTGVVILFALLLAGTISLLFTLLKRESALLPALLVTLLVLAASKIHWLARPHVFSLLFMVVFQQLLEKGRAGRSLILLPPLMLVWVNMHGGFVGGFILLGAYLVGAAADLCRAPAGMRETAVRRVRELVAVTAASLAACCINPNGCRILLFPFRLVADRYLMDHVTEFLSPNFHGPLPFKYLLPALIVVLAWSGRRPTTVELVLVVVFTNMALYSARYIPLFALVTAPIISRRLTGEGREDSASVRFLGERSRRVSDIDSRASGHLWCVISVIAVMCGALSGSVTHAFDENTKPIAACSFLLRERIAGNMFNNDEFGDYMIYRAYPAYRVFIDGRLDMYGEGLLREYYRVAAFEPGWEETLEKYGVTWVLFETSAPFSRYLVRDRNWALVYSDRVASIFVKRTPEHRALTEKYRNVPLALDAARRG